MSNINACSISNGRYAVHYFSHVNEWPNFPASSWSTDDADEVPRIVANLLKQNGGRIAVEIREAATVHEFLSRAQLEICKS